MFGLNEIERPPSDSPGAWYQLGDRQLHLIASEDSTFRKGKVVDDRDIHFALRVTNYSEMRKFLLSKGFHPEADDELKKMKESPGVTSGLPRLHIMDPDRNVIELSAEQLDAG
ncbi:MAG: glyoxalase [Actinomycetota bacterium]|nr:glyoxalase [Actinomycetota bacterium]